jgi:hypothetical protein
MIEEHSNFTAETHKAAGLYIVMKRKWTGKK